MSDTNSLIALFKETRDKLIAERTTHLERAAAIEEQLAEIGVPINAPVRRGRPPKIAQPLPLAPGVLPKRRGRPPKIATALPVPMAPTALPARANGHAKKEEAPQGTTDFIRWILAKAPGIPLDSIAVAATDAMDKPPSRKDLHNTLFSLAKRGEIVRKGDRGERTYFLAKQH